MNPANLIEDIGTRIYWAALDYFVKLKAQGKRIILWEFILEPGVMDGLEMVQWATNVCFWSSLFEDLLRTTPSVFPIEFVDRVLLETF